jgi:hypothetical protein
LIAGEQGKLANHPKIPLIHTFLDKGNLNSTAGIEQVYGFQKRGIYNVAWLLWDWLWWQGCCRTDHFVPARVCLNSTSFMHAESA